MKCTLPSCSADAICQVGMQVWPEVFGRQVPPLVSYYPMALCAKHRDECQLRYLLTNDAKERFNSKLQAEGSALADWSTAELIFHEILDGKLHVIPMGDVRT